MIADLKADPSKQQKTGVDAVRSYEASLEIGGFAECNFLSRRCHVENEIPVSDRHLLF